MNSRRTIVAMWLNASQKSSVDVEMHRSPMGRSVRRFDRSNTQDAALYIYNTFYTFSKALSAIAKIDRNLCSVNLL